MKKQMGPIFMRNRQWVFWQIQQEIPLKAENTKLSDPGMQNEDDIQPVADETGMAADGFYECFGIHSNRRYFFKKKQTRYP